MTRFLTALVLSGLAFAGYLNAPAPSSSRPFETPDGFAATPLWLSIGPDGSIADRGVPLHLRDVKDSDAVLSEATKRAMATFSEEQALTMASHVQGIHGGKSGTEGWLRVMVDGRASFQDVSLIMRHQEYWGGSSKFAFEITDGEQPVFARTRRYWQELPDGSETQARWLVQWLDYGELGFKYEGVRHVLGKDLGVDTLGVDSYHETAVDAFAHCERPLPELLIEADVPWSEVAKALRLRAVDRIALCPTYSTP